MDQPKKRGRKPKVKEVTEEPKLEEKKVEKKRGRKPKDKVYSLLAMDKTPVFTTIQESFIISLKIQNEKIDALNSIFNQKQQSSIDIGKFTSQLNDINQNTTGCFSDVQYETMESIKNASSQNNLLYGNYRLYGHRMPVTDMKDYIFLNIKSFDLKVDKEVVSSQSNKIDTNRLQKYQNAKIDVGMVPQHFSRKIAKIMPLFNEIQNWPKSTSYCCWNDGEPFDGVPCGIPHKYVYGKFYLFGNFCSFNCAGRYLFDHYDGEYLFESFSLLNLLCQIINDLENSYVIKLAPDPICLQKYAGKEKGVSIEDYRSSFYTNDSYNLYKPPLIPMLYYLDEINETNNNSLTSDIKSKEILFDQQQQNQVNRALRLYRSKPLKNVNTIDKCMNITIEQGGCK